MLVVGELEEPFVPLPDDLLVNLRDSRAVVEALLDALPGNFASPSATPECATGPALQARATAAAGASHLRPAGSPPPSRRNRPSPAAPIARRRRAFISPSPPSPRPPSAYPF